MFIINRDNTISINQGDTFNLACVSDMDMSDKFRLIIHDEDKIVLQKNITVQDDIGYFIFNYEDTINIDKGAYKYTIKYEDNGINLTVIESKILIKEGIKYA